LNEQYDVAMALKPVADAFGRLGLQFYVGGSVASSFHGAMRSTMDIDVVADIGDADVGPLIKELGEEYYASESAIRVAVRRKSSFNLIHFATSFKVDVFAHRRRAFDTSAFARATPGQIGSDAGFSAPIATAEDIIISKLEWYRLGNEVSERQWKDVTTVLLLLGDRSDLPYLRKFAESVGVDDLLERLLAERRR
jgi:hypothetical protein